MNRCGAMQDSTNPNTQCWLDPGHCSAHRRYAEPERPAIEWTQPRIITLTEWIKERIRVI